MIFFYMYFHDKPWISKYNKISQGSVFVHNAYVQWDIVIAVDKFLSTYGDTTIGDALFRDASWNFERPQHAKPLFTIQPQQRRVM